MRLLSNGKILSLDLCHQTQLGAKSTRLFQLILPIQRLHHITTANEDKTALRKHDNKRRSLYTLFLLNFIHKVFCQRMPTTPNTPPGFKAVKETCKCAVITQFGPCAHKLCYHPVDARF